MLQFNVQQQLPRWGLLAAVGLWIVLLLFPRAVADADVKQDICTNKAFDAHNALRCCWQYED